MLQQFFHIIVVSIICMIWGIPFLLVLLSSIKKNEFWYHSTAGLLSFLFLCGCTTISIFSGWIYLFIPLKFSFLLFFTLALSLYLLLFQRKKLVDIFSKVKRPERSSFTVFLFVAASIFLFVLLSALSPVNGDTQIYHLQIIQWQTQYKIVHGLANLYPRLGLSSNWFNLISFFYWPFLKTENFTYVNAAFVTWFFIWLFSKWRFYFLKKNNDSNGKALTSFYFLLFLYCMFDWQLYRDSANSTNYDFAVNAFTIIVSSFFIEGVLVNKPRNEFSFAVLIFSLSAISFKLSGLFLGLFIFYHIIVARKTVKWLVAIIVGGFILLPVLIKNYIVTGYPLFPSTITINRPDWIFPKQLAIGFYRYIILSNRFYNYQWSFINTITHTNFNWIPYWFNGILWKHKIIFALSICSIVFFFRSSNLPINNRQLRQVILILLLMLAGWFFTAPDPGRFGYGILLSISSLTVSFFIFRFLRPVSYLVLLSITVVIAIYTVKKMKPISSDLSHLIYPIAFKEPPYQNIPLDNINLKLPYQINNNWDCRCYLTPLPCITQKNPYLQARGKNPGDGFRMSEPDTSFIHNFIY